MWQAEVESVYQSIFKEKGDEVQKLSVIETLPQLLAEDAHSCITQVLPKIQQSLPTASPEFHMAAAGIFKQVLEQRLVSNATFAEVFLQTIITSIESREPAVSHAWLETMLDVIELLPLDIIRREILPIAIASGKISQTVNSRITSSRLMGKMATRFDSAFVQKEMFPTVQTLCQDVSNEVRACVCLQLTYVAQNLGEDVMKLLPFLIELTSDEESNVRQAAVQTIGHLLPQIQPDTIKDVMIPLIKETCETALKTEDDVLGVITQEYGKLAQNCETYLIQADKAWFVNYYVKLAQMGTNVTSTEDSKHNFSFNMDNNEMNNRIAEYRQNCAYNIPAMFIFALSVPEGINMLIPIFRNLASDSNYSVRRTIACSLHEIIKVLGSKSGLIKVELLKLLKDNNEEVLQGLVPNISEVLNHLLENKLIGIDRSESWTVDLGRALIRCEDRISSTHNWRLQVLMLNQFEALPKHFSSDFIYTYLVPIVSHRIMYSRPLPVRLAAGRTLLVFLRYNLNCQQRVEIRNMFCTEIAHSQNSYRRMLFIQIMIEGISIFSSVYFKEHFCYTLLSLMEDPIANVRFKMVTLVPTIKSCLRLPADKKLLSTLETNIRNLMVNEKDRDVSAALIKATDQIENIEVRIDSQPSPTKLSRYDSEDMKKFEEEKKLEGMLTNKTTVVPKKRPSLKPSNRIGLAGPSSPVKSSSKAGSQISRNSEFTRSSVLSKPPLTRQNAVSNRQIPDSSKASTSTDNLTSNWPSRFTSDNNPRLIKPWERMTTFSSHNTNFTSTNPSCNNECSTHKEKCSCHQLADRFLLTRPFARGFSLQDGHCNLAGCHYINNGLRPHSSSSLSSNSDYQISDPTKSSSSSSSSLLTHPQDDKHGIWQDLMLTRSNFVSEYSRSHSDAFLSHYNPYWNFSSASKVPSTLLDDEFMVDAGVRFPSSVAADPPRVATSLQDILQADTRLSTTEQMRRCGPSPFSKTKSMNFGLSRRFSVDYDEGGGADPLPMPPPPSSAANLSSNDCKPQYSQNQTRFGLELNGRKLLDDAKRNSTFTDKNNIKSKGIDDKNKRPLTSYGMKLSDNKESKLNKFKRHNMEVDDYNPSDRSSSSRTLRRFSTLDVNHNQGLSKIPVRNIHTSGSRTAPVTRTSSPIRVDSELIESLGYRKAPTFSHGGRLRRFRSSDEEVENLCQKF